MNLPLEDAELVAQVRNGESTAYVELVRRYERNARVIAMRYLRDRSLVDDVLQEAFLIGFEKLHTLKKPSSFSYWLLRIVQRESQAMSQSRRRVGELPDSIEAAPPTSHEWELLDWVVDSLNELPEHERIVVSLHYLDGLSAREVAAMLSRPVGTVTKQLSRAIKRLKSLSISSRGICHEN